MLSGSRRKAAAVGLAIVAIGLVFRLWNLSYGLPYVLHADEATLVNMIVRMVKTVNPNPQFIRYPSLFFDANALALVPYYAIGKVRGAFHSVVELRATTVVAMGVALAEDPAIVMIGRTMSTIASLGGVAGTFLLGRRVALLSAPENEARSLWLGGIAALAMAVSPNVVEEAQWTVVDSHVLPWVALCLWAAVGILQRERASDYVIFGIAGGLAASVKYNAALVLLALPLAHWISSSSRRWIDWRLLLGVLCAWLVFGITSPYVVLNWPGLATAMNAGILPGSDSELADPSMRPIIVEGLICVAAVVGVVAGLIGRRKSIGMLSLYALIYLVIAARLPGGSKTMLFPVLSACYVVGAWYLLQMADRISEWRAFANRPVWLRETLMALALVALWLAPVSATVARGIERSAPDSRTTAVQWLSAEIPEGSTICLEAYTPYVDPSRYNVVNVGFACRQPPQWYIDQGCEYVILGELAYQRYFDDPQRYAEQIASYRAVMRAFSLERQFDDGGYTVKVLRVPQPADS